jgi:hypothetical protein
MLGLVNRDRSTKRWFGHRFSFPRGRGTAAERSGPSTSLVVPFSFALRLTRTAQRDCRLHLLPLLGIDPATLLGRADEVIE